MWHAQSLLLGESSEINKNMHIFLSDLYLYEFLNVFPFSAIQSNRAKLTTVWEHNGYRL